MLLSRSRENSKPKNTFIALIDTTLLNLVKDIKQLFVPHFRKHKYKISENILENIIILNIEKQSNVNWKQTRICPLEANIPKNRSYYRIVLYKVKSGIIFLEKNGQINIDSFLTKFEFEHFKLIKSKKPKDVHTFQSLVLKSLKTDIEKLTQKSCLDNLVERKLLFSFSWERAMKLGNDLFKKEVDQKDQLIDWINTENEGDYNLRVCETNPERYLLFDKKLIEQTEVLDVFDKETDYCFHIKKHKACYATLIRQVVEGASTLLNAERRHLFERKMNFKFPEKFTYIFGIIGCPKKYKSKSHIFTLGLGCHILEEMGIEYKLARIKVKK